MCANISLQNSKKQVLLISSGRCKNLWVVPGGGLEPGEEPETTAAREVDEEVSFFRCFKYIS